MKSSTRTARGYELYGSIAVVEAGPNQAKRIAQRLLRFNKNIKTVLRKGGAVSGRYRTRKFLYVAGTRNYLTDYKENGCTFRFDIRKVFFSTKLAYERKRISDLVKNGEKVVVMFAGIGPYAIEIAKARKKCEVIAIELNSMACKYMRENVIINKTPNVIVEKGDAKLLAKKHPDFADRIVMPLPKEAPDFFPAALKMSKQRCIIHCYSFCENDKVDKMIKATRNFFEERKKRFKLLGHRTVRPYSATEAEIALDFLIY
jgi:tRNA (guanine37-N1)-methyltransferase